jgi:hypothetical protein
MKKIIFLFILIGKMLFAQNEYVIKSLRIYQTGNETSFPISVNDSKITIDFDLKAKDTPNWEINFKLCDNNWQPYEDDSMIDYLTNTAHNLWFETLPFRGDRANYHYKGSFPNKEVKFPLAGKWMFFIRDVYNHENIYGEGKFYVVKNTEVNLRLSLQEKSLQGRDIVPAVFGEVWNMKVSVTMPDSLYADKIERVEIIENKKIADPIIIERTYGNDERYYEIDAINSYSFFANNIHPGSAYRQVNLMDRTKYSPPKTNAHFEGVDVSHKFKPGVKDFFGGCKILNYRNEYSEYMDVVFDLRLPENYYQNIFLVGAFTDWDIYPEYEMVQKKDGLFSTTVELKRGIYDYQYVVVDYKGDYINKIDWIELEGNSWKTNREFHIFLFYKSDEFGEYDKIIGYRKIWSRSR